jgi:hypothetical protein
VAPVGDREPASRRFRVFAGVNLQFPRTIERSAMAREPTRCIGRHTPATTHAALALGTLLALASVAAHATEGGLCRPISGSGVNLNAGIVPPEPIWAANVSQLYLDGTVGDQRQVPIAGRVAFGIDTQVSFTLETLLRVWDAVPGRWIPTIESTKRLDSTSTFMGSASLIF